MQDRQTLTGQRRPASITRQDLTAVVGIDAADFAGFA
jgi:hypothetical protein